MTMSYLEMSKEDAKEDDSEDKNATECEKKRIKRIKPEQVFT